MNDGVYKQEHSKFVDFMVLWHFLYYAVSFFSRDIQGIKAAILSYQNQRKCLEGNRLHT